VPSPALDKRGQPDYAFYVKDNLLDKDKYRKSISSIFSMIKLASEIPFGKDGFKGIILSKFGQGSFLKGLPGGQQFEANRIFEEELSKFLRLVDKKLDVRMSIYSLQDPTMMEPEFEKAFVGDIIASALDGYLIVNAWDPTSAPGNGNDEDPTFDGAMGKGSGILVTQSAWLNKKLRTKEALVAI